MLKAFNSTTDGLYIHLPRLGEIRSLQETCKNSRFSIPFPIRRRRLGFRDLSPGCSADQSSSCPPLAWSTLSTYMLAYICTLFVYPSICIIIYIHAHTYMQLHRMCKQICMHRQTPTYVCICVCMHGMYVCIYICMQVCMYVSMYVCIYVCTFCLGLIYVRMQKY